MSDLTMRQKLHNAADNVEDTFAEKEKACRKYDKARDTLNELIDSLCPLDQPNGREPQIVYKPVGGVATKIALIKMIREQSIIAARRAVMEERDSVDIKPIAEVYGIGLKEAKDAAEAWIEKEIEAQRNQRNAGMGA